MFTQDVVIRPATSHRRHHSHQSRSTTTDYPTAPWGARSCSRDQSSMERQPTPAPGELAFFKTMKLSLQLSSQLEQGDDAPAVKQPKGGEGGARGDGVVVVSIRADSLSAAAAAAAAAATAAAAQPAHSSAGATTREPSATGGAAAKLVQLRRTSPFAAPEVQACTCYRQRCTCPGQRAPARRSVIISNSSPATSGPTTSGARRLKQQLKAAIRALAEGMAFARVCVAAPVPACPSGGLPAAARLR